jgi:hypothetical protein
VLAWPATENDTDAVTVPSPLSAADVNSPGITVALTTPEPEVEAEPVAFGLVAIAVTVPDPLVDAVAV